MVNELNQPSRRALRRPLAALGFAGVLALSSCAPDSDDVAADNSADEADVDDAAVENDAEREAEDAAGGTSDAFGSTPNPTSESGEPILDARDATRESVATSEAEWTVGMDASVAGFGSGGYNAELSASFDPSQAADPFGDFAACSGLRTQVGAYSVFVSGTGGAEFIGLSTADAVTAAGIYEAEVRVERSGEQFLATGTVTLDEGLQTGTFSATGRDDGRIDGSFECAGSPPPTVLALGDPGDETLESVEVFALLQRGTAERVIGLATDDARLAACPGAEGGRGEDGTIVSVVGGATLGSITAFELVDGALDVTVGGTIYSFDDVALVTADGTAGTFGATNQDGVSVDGAFRCT